MIYKDSYRETISNYTLDFNELNLATIPETWIRYFNGPNAGFIDMELAKKEMPWLIGIPLSYTLTIDS